jgi:hypothetical protein
MNTTLQYGMLLSFVLVLACYSVALVGLLAEKGRG